MQFEELKRRPFSFYPTILNVEYNEWRLRRTTGPEILVTNIKSDLEVWIPKKLVKEISDAGGPALIVSLRSKLEYKAGALQPYERKLAEMPAPAGDGFSRTPGREPRKSPRRIRAAGVAAACVACLLVIFLLRFAVLRRSGPATPGRDLLALTARDDYASVVRKLGPPAGQRERPPYRALWYPRRRCTVVLRGTQYVGALDSNWRPICHVELPDGDSVLLLRSLPRF